MKFEAKYLREPWGSLIVGSSGDEVSFWARKGFKFSCDAANIEKVKLVILGVIIMLNYCKKRQLLYKIYWKR
jgi:hypothetical protein